MLDRIAEAKELLEKNPAKFFNRKKAPSDLVAYLNNLSSRVKKHDQTINNPDLEMFFNAIADYLTERAEEFSPDADWELVFEIFSIGVSYE